MDNDKNQPVNLQDTESNLNRALDGQYDFNVRDLLSRSHALMKAHYWDLLSACAVLVAVVAVLMFVLLSFYSSEQLLELSGTQQAVIDLVAILVLSPIITGLIMICVRAAQGEKVAPLRVFRYLPIALSLALAQLIISVLVQTGLALFILPGIHLFIASSFTLPLIADRNLNVFSALVLSFRVVNRYLRHFFVLFLVFSALSLLCVLTLGLALVWVMPLYYSVFGTLYNDLFGCQQAPAARLIPLKQEYHFDA